MHKESTLALEQADWTHTVRAGDYWMDTIRAGDVFRITDLMGNQAVDTLFFNARQPLRTLQRRGHHPRARETST